MALGNVFEQVKEWWLVSVASGSAICVSALPADNPDGFLCGLGLALFGLGHGICRKKEVWFQSAPGGGHVKVENPVFRATPVGILFIAAGLALLVFGLWRVSGVYFGAVFGAVWGGFTGTVSALWGFLLWAVSTVLNFVKWLIVAAWCNASAWVGGGTCA